MHTEWTEIHAEASKAASAAADSYLDKYGDRSTCGFSWVEVYGVKLNTLLGKQMAASGFTRYRKGVIMLWNPSKCHAQSVNCLEEGSRAYAAVLKQHGIDAYSASRLD